MSPLSPEDYPADMGYYDRTPLQSRYPMSWPPLRCNTCGDPDMVWAYPVGAVEFSRQVSEDGEVREIQHDAQPWFACARCQPHVQADTWEELAEEIGKPAGYFRRLADAKISEAPGYRWATVKARNRR